MISLNSNSNCCGCGACVQKCPKQCISLHEDKEGFLYPRVNTDTCVNCGLCEKVCPMLTPYESRKPLQVLAAINNDKEIRMQSSSGGIFTLLAEKVINEGGVVFGARFDEDWQVTLDYTETIEGLAPFRGSKYVQARTGETYKQCENFLKDGRKVLYSGTPCQIAGLTHFLKRKYDNLITVEIICHGTPSPKIWHEYLRTFIQEPKEITYINFREKQIGGGYNYVIKSGSKTLFDDAASKSLYSLGFIENYYVRPSCFYCKAKSGRSHADFTLGDCWGIETIDKGFDDGKGISVVCINTHKAITIAEELSLKSIEIPLEILTKYNPCYNHSTKESLSRHYFWRKHDMLGFDAIKITRNHDLNILIRIIRKLKDII